MNRVGTLLLLAFLPVSGCFCEQETFTEVAPIIELLDPFIDEQSPCAVDNFRECTYNFGEVEITSGRFFRFRITNPSPIVLVVDNIVVEGDPAFSLNDSFDFPLRIPPLEDEIEPTEVTVRFTPSLESNVEGTVTIFSDGVNLEENDPEDPDDDEQVVVALTGTGIDLGRPELVVTPASCDFGEVGVGVAAFCDVTLENIGSRDLQIEQTSFTAETPLASDDGGNNFDTELNGFGRQTLLFFPLFIAPGTATSVRLFANPPTPNAMNGTWIIPSNDVANPTVEVPLNVLGAEAPTAVAEVASINGALNDNPSPEVQPLDDVILTGENSVAANAMGTIVAWQWEIISQPPESSAVLSNPTGETTGFQFDSAGGTFTGLDVAGTYEIGLTVTDDGTPPLTSSNEATVVLNAIPQDALHVQLTWDSPDYDIDVHVIKDGGPYCSQQSCYYGNCKQTSALRPEWDGLPGPTSGDPSLDIDDLSGYGPENVNVDVPIDGNYRVGVHAFSFTLTEEVFATLKIFINGALAFEDARQLEAGRDFWEVAEVQWNNGGAIVFPVGNYEQSWSCP